MFISKKDLLQRICTLEEKMKKIEAKDNKKDYKILSTSKMNVKTITHYTEHFLEQIRINKYKISQEKFCKMIGIPAGSYNYSMARNDFGLHNNKVLEFVNEIFLKDKLFFNNYLQANETYKDYMKKIQKKRREAKWN